MGRRKAEAIELEKITPAIAREWIKKIDPHQRKPSMRVIEKITNSIEEHGWQYLLSQVVWSDEGTIIDGQHTLIWIGKQSPPNKKFEVIVKRGVPKSAISILGGDASKPWSFRDRAWLRYGIRIGTSESAISRFLHMTIDQQPEPTSDEVRMQIFTRWQPVIEHARIKFMVDGIKNPRKSQVMAAIGFARLINPSGTSLFEAELRGDSGRSHVAKALVVILRDWISTSNAGTNSINQSLRAMRCVEVGTGLTSSGVRLGMRQIESGDVPIPDDMIDRWAGMYSEYLRSRST